MKAHRVSLSSSHGAQRAESDHTVIHPFICNVFIRFLGEKVSLVHDWRFLSFEKGSLFFVAFGNGINLACDFFDFEGLFLLYS